MFRFYFVFCLFLSSLDVSRTNVVPVIHTYNVLIERHRKHTYLPSIDPSHFSATKKERAAVLRHHRERKEKTEARRGGGAQHDRAHVTRRKHTHREQQRRRERDDDKSDDDDDADDVRVVRRCFFASKSKRKIETSSFSSPEIKSFDDDE